MARKGFGRRDERVSAVLAAALGAMTFGADSPATAHARMQAAELAAEVRTYHIPAGTVGMALARIAEQNGVQMVFPAGLTRTLTTGGLTGDFTLGSALDRLLAGTGLSYRLADNQRDVFIVLAQADNGVRSDATPEALPTIDIGPERSRTDGKSRPGLTPQNSYVTPVVSVGTKTDTPVMNTPVNVQAITQKALEDQQAINLTEALKNVSGVVVATGATTGGFSRTSGIFIRGFATSNVYRDGFRLESISNVDTTGSRQLANVGSIEVLKGPAAILYGLSEPGGIVNITTKDPQETPHYSIDQQIGSLALYRTTINATGPLTQDKSVLYRLDTSYESNGAPYGSFIDLTHSQNFFVAPVVKWNLSESTWVKGEVEYANDLTSVFRPDNPIFRGAFVTRPRDVNYFGNSPAHAPSIFASLTGSHKFNEDWSLKARVGYYRADYNSQLTLPNGSNVSGGAVPTILRGTLLTRVPQTTLSTNLDIVGHFDLVGARNTLLFGGDFYQTRYSSNLTLAPWGWSIVSFADPFPPGVPTIVPASQTQLVDSRQDTAGVYLQDEIELPYDIHVMAGLRYQSIRQQNSSTLTVNSASSVSGGPLDKDAVTPRFGLLWRPQQWVSFYGNYTEGYGPNSGFVYPGTLAPPSNASSWEAGAKFEFFDGKLRATADYYDLTKTNVPIRDPDTTHICGGGSCVVLTGEARSRGPEIDIQGELLPGWNVIATYTNQDVRVTKGASLGFGQSGVQPGQRFPNVPRNLASLWSTYEFQDSFLKGLKVGAGYTYHGSQTVQDSTSGRFGVPPLVASWGTVDLMSAYTFDFDGVKTTAQINVTNLFDRTYYTDATVNTNPTAGFTLGGRVSYGAPFAVRGSLRMEF